MVRSLIQSGAVLELLARGFTRLDRAIDQLSSFWDVDFWRIALERVATGRGDGAVTNEQARAGDDACPGKPLPCPRENPSHPRIRMMTF